MKYEGALAYYSGKREVGDTSFRISASQISRFFSHTNQWYREHLLKEDGFLSSTSSVLGSVVHRMAEQYARNGEVTEQDYKDIEEYIDAYTTPGYDEYNPEVDATVIRQQYPIMGNTLINGYVADNMPTEVEPFYYKEMLPQIGIGGSVDGVLIEDGITCVTDYKTINTLSIPDKISYQYRLQLLVYAYLLSKNGHNVQQIRIIYVSRNNVGRVSEKTGKPLKSYPSQVKVITETINQQDLLFIEDIIKLVTESVECWNKLPKMRYLLAQDFRLKQGNIVYPQSVDTTEDW